MADEFHFYNLVYNVIDNAVKYSENEVSHYSKYHPKKITKDCNSILSDKGVGIPENDLPFVFDKFYRVAREDSKDIEGFRHWTCPM
jgi:two-component system phosphate regulon sensor histidine kinase PhoR